LESNSTLPTKTINSASVEIVLGAIEALKEAMDNGDIQRPGGWLNTAEMVGYLTRSIFPTKAERDSRSGLT